MSLPDPVFGVHGIAAAKRAYQNVAYGRHVGQVEQRIYRPVIN